MKTKPLWICHPPVILSWAAGSLFSESSMVTASCAQPGFPFWSLSLKTKRVVSMLSENYSVQDISSSYLLLKDTFLVVTVWVSPFAQLAILKLWNMLDKREDQCFMGWLVHGNYDFQKLVLSLSWPKEQRKTWETWRMVNNIECTAGLSLTAAGSLRRARHTKTWCILFILALIRTTASVYFSLFDFNNSHSVPPLWECKVCE